MTTEQTVRAATAKQVRADTRAAGSPRGSRRRAPEDLYILGACVVLTIVEAVGIVSAPGHSAGILGGRATAEWFLAASEPTGAIAGLLLAMTTTLFTLVRRIGPVVMTRAQVHWWLPLPVDRGGLVLPGYLLSLLVPVGVLSVATAIVLAGTGAAFTGAASAGIAAEIVTLLLTMASVVCLAALTHSAAVWIQYGQVRRRVRSRFDTVMRFIPMAMLLAVLGSTAVRAFLFTAIGAPLPLLEWFTWLPTGWPVLVASGALWPVLVLVPAALLAVGGAGRGLRSLSRFGLGRSADAGSLAAEALLSMELGDVVGEPAARATSLERRRRRPRRSPATGSARRFVLTQFTVWWRTRGQAAGFISLALLPVVVLAVPYLNLGAVLISVFVVCVLRAVSIAGSGARVLSQRPGLGRLFPIGDGTQRRLMSVLPACLLVPWCLLCFGLVAGVGAAPASWAWFAVPVALGLAGTAVRTGFRPATDWETPLISTEMGAVSTGWVANALHGRAATVVVVFPALVAIAGGAVTPALVLFQWVISAVVWWWCTRVATSGSLAITWARWTSGG